MHKYADTADTTNDPIPVAIVGVTGYSGLELARLLRRHPHFSLRVGFSTHIDGSLKDFVPSRWARTVPVISLAELPRWSPQLKAVFLATPAEVSAKLAPELLKSGAHVIDLSGAFRLKGATPEKSLELYRNWYGMEHPSPDLLPIAEYGLCPWQQSGTAPSPKPRLVANPGCYATAVLMGLLPLLKRDLILPETLVIDAKSGASGAGRKAEEHLLFTEVDGECLPYRIGRHQHFPEIQQFSKEFGGRDVEPFFATHLLPTRRGILSALYARLRKGVGESDLAAAFAMDYSDYGLVDSGPLGKEGTRADNAALSLKRIAGSSFTRIRYQVLGDQLYLFSLIDNLIKGAAGQAIENLNRLYGWPESLGLEELEGVL